jgi:hypothetical protein
MADDITTVPISLRSRFKSIKIFAMTGKAEMERAVPTNKEPRKQSRRAQTKRKGDNHAAHTYEQSALTLAENASQIDLKTGCEQEEHDAKRRDAFHDDRHRAGARE